MQDSKSFLWRLVELCGVPLIVLFCTLHFLLCVSLSLIFFFDENKCRKVYEYYAPWGWGERKNLGNHDGETTQEK